MSRPINPDDLLVFLAVARTGRLVAAARVLGLNHTTVSRRIDALEDAAGERLLVRERDGWVLTDAGQEAMQAAEKVEAAVGELARPGTGERGLSGVVRIAAPDGFSSRYATPAIVDLARRHPRLHCELVTATQRVRQSRAGVDIEVVVGEPQVHKATALPLLDYTLGLYATPGYLERAGTPDSIADLAGHSLIYYISSALQVDDLDLATQGFPAPVGSLSSTSVFVHVRATALGAGIGVLPDFLAATEPSLVRVLPDAYAHPVTYWAVIRAEAYRSPAVAAALAALRRAVA